MIEADAFGTGRLVAVAVGGLLLGSWFARAERSPFGERPQGDLPDTTVPLLLAALAWVVSMAIAGAFVGGEDTPYWQRALATQAVNGTVAVGLLPFVLLSSFRPVASRGRLLAVAALGGVVVFLGVSLIGDLVTLFYSLFGLDPLLQENVQVAHGEWSIDVAAVFLTAIVTAPFAEEVFYRGTLLPALANALPMRWALVVQALVFGMMHVLGDPARWPIGLALSAVGYACGWIYVRTGSIWVAIGVHAAFNALNLAVMRLVVA